MPGFWDPCRHAVGLTQVHDKRSSTKQPTETVEGYFVFPHSCSVKKKTKHVETYLSPELVMMVLGCKVLMTPGESKLPGEETVRVLNVVPGLPSWLVLLMMMVVALDDASVETEAELLPVVTLMPWFSWMRFCASARRCCLSCCSMWAFICAVVCWDVTMLDWPVAAFSAFSCRTCLCFSNL